MCLCLYMGAVSRASARLCVPSITGAAADQPWWEALHHGRGQCYPIRAFGFFLFGEPLLDTDQADRARWANQFLPLGIWNWGQGKHRVGVLYSCPTPLLRAPGRREEKAGYREAFEGMSRVGESISGSWPPELLHGLSGLLECTWITGRQVFTEELSSKPQMDNG